MSPKLEYSVESPLNREPPVEELISKYGVVPASFHLESYYTELMIAKFHYREKWL